MTDTHDAPRRSGRRAFLATAATGATAATAGCFGIFDDGSSSTVPDLAAYRGSGALVEGRPAPGGTSIQDLPELSGSLDVYLGGGESGLYRTFVNLLERTYPDFDPVLRDNPSAQLAETIVSEHESGSPQADVFWSVDVGSLGYVAERGAARSLPQEVREPLPDPYVSDTWAGVAGRARSVPVNTNALSTDDVPASVMEFPDTDGLAGAMGWAPSYGAFQSFVTAMRLLEGRSTAKSWLQSMVDAGTTRYPDEFLVSNAVADGEIDAGFANHYYAMRVQAARADAPIELAFTEGDAGALVNVAGASILKGTDRADRAATFLRHLLSAEAQEFFATRTYAYPLIPEVSPVGDLPTIDALSPPDLDLTKLSEIGPTIELLKEVGLLS